MTTAAHEIIADESAQVALRDVERELSRRMKLVQGATRRRCSGPACPIW